MKHTRGCAEGRAANNARERGVLPSSLTRRRTPARGGAGRPERLSDSSEGRLSWGVPWGGERGGGPLAGQMPYPAPHSQSQVGAGGGWPMRDTRKLSAAWKYTAASPWRLCPRYAAMHCTPRAYPSARPYSGGVVCLALHSSTACAPVMRIMQRVSNASSSITCASVRLRAPRAGACTLRICTRRLGRTMKRYGP